MATRVALSQNAGVELTANKNAASGYAGLDASSKLTGSQQLYSSSGTIGTVGQANAAGSANSAARGDHTHRGDLIVHAVQRADDATLGTSTSTTRVTLHTVNLSGLLVNQLYEIEVKCAAIGSAVGDFPQLALYKTNTSGTAWDRSTMPRIQVGTGDVHELTCRYFYKTGAAETSFTVIVAGWREAGSGTATFKAYADYPYQFKVTQMGLVSLNSF